MSETKMYSEEDVLRIIQAAKQMFPVLVACDGILLVPVDSYNTFAEVCNEILTKRETNDRRK